MVSEQTSPCDKNQLTKTIKYNIHTLNYDAFEILFLVFGMNEYVVSEQKPLWDNHRIN